MKIEELHVEKLAMMFQDSLMALRETGDETNRARARICTQRMDDYGKSDWYCSRLAVLMRADLKDEYKQMYKPVVFD